MKTMIAIAALLAAFASTHSHALGVQYLLHTAPATPVSGEDFLAVFRDLECEEFFLVPPGAPPTVRVEGNVVTVAADRVDVLDCSSPAETYSIGISGLPAGNYTLRLAARGETTAAVAAGRHLAPSHATVRLVDRSHWVQAVVSAEIRPFRAFPGFTVSAETLAEREDR